MMVKHNPRIGLACLLLCGASLAQERVLLGGSEDPKTRAFQIYDTQAARAAQQEAEEHFASGRIREGLSQLQRLIERHRGEVLAAQRPQAIGAPRPSREDVHAGASSWALRRLFELPPESREVYLQRYGPRAQEALERALASGDAAALVEIGGRWPLTPASERAWWAVGDLETEAGQIASGRIAWGRALALALGDPANPPQEPDEWASAIQSFATLEARADDVPGARARVQRVQADLAAMERGTTAAHAAGSQATNTDADWANALDPGSDLGRPFSSQTEAWSHGYELPNNPFETARHALYPVRSGDTVFLTTSRQLVAVEAYTGQEIWRSSRADLGWTPLSAVDPEFKVGIDRENNLQAPAVGQGVAVAALQVPFKFNSSDRFKDLNIITPIPERRLVAFHEKTGELLWHAMPPEDWDGESGSYAERAAVVGPPVLAGNRVLVPTARMRGRIEFHVGCFDLATGNLLWYAPLITGQRELNMFGREEKEFCAPPVVVKGDRVFVQTQLGTVASLDLFTGDVLWQSLYPQLDISEANYYTAGQMNTVWHNTPPALAGRCLVATPVDSNFLLGFDTETGAVLWRVRHQDLAKVISPGGSQRALRYLVGADDQSVLLGGRRLVSFRTASDSLVSAPPSLLHWSWPVDGDLRTYDPRPVVDGSALYVPHENTLARVDRATGRLLSELEWGLRRGNLLITDGQLFSLSTTTLWGFFEWDTMLDRAEARLAENPDDERQLVTYARLLLQRASAAREAATRETSGTANLQLAAAAAERSASLLEERLAESEPSSEVEDALYDVLLESAWIHRQAANSRRGLAALEQALGLASTERQRLEALLLVQSLLRDRDPAQRNLVLTELIDSYGPVELACFIIDEQWSPGEGAPWQGQIEPARVSLRADKDVDPSTSMALLPIGLWGLVERIESRRDEHESSAAPAIYADLHRILRDYPDWEFRGTKAGSWASERIGGMRAQRIDTGYDRFAEEARALLNAAKSAADLDSLAKVPLLYPYSPAASEANDERIRLSLDLGDTSLVASIVLGELEERWSFDQASQREIDNLVRLAEVAGDGGNLKLRAGLTARLAEYHPSAIAATRGAGRQKLEELSRLWSEAAADEVPIQGATFGTRLSQSGLFDEGIEAVGVASGGASKARPLTIYAGRRASRASQFVYGIDNDPSAPLWRTRTWDRGIEPPLDEHIGISADSVHIAGQTRAVALTPSNGKEIWRWLAEDNSEIREQFVQDGVVALVLERPNSSGDRSYLIVALDASTGSELWRVGGIDKSFNQSPVVGDGYVVLLPTKQGRHAEAFDLYTGTAVSRFYVATKNNFDTRGAWITKGQLILPHFIRIARPDENRIQAYDLASGTVAWRVEIPHSLEIHRVLRHGSDVVLQLNHDTEDDESTPGLYRLNSRLGSLEQRPLASLPPGSDFIGLPRYNTVELDHPTLLAFVRGPRGKDRLRAVDVRLGSSWESSLPDGFLTSNTTDLPRPVVSDSTLALVLSMRPGQSARRSSRLPIGLVLLERGTGALASTIPLSAAHGHAHNVVLHGQGNTLLVSGEEITELFR